MAVTRDDVARLAGVSTAVVSYVLNDGPKPVSVGARARVLAAIEELGYQRDGVARYLRTGKTHSVGLLLPDVGLPYFSEITRELIGVAAGREYQVVIANSLWDVDDERNQLARLAERRVDGIVLMSVDPEQDFSKPSAVGIPLVVVDRPRFAVTSARIATGHLLGHGHRRIAIVAGPPALTAARRRREGWAAALSGAGVAAPDGYALEAPVSRTGGYEAIGRLLALPARPTAVYVGSDAQAAGMLRACQDAGVRVPDDLAIVTSEGTEVARFATPSLTSTEQPIATIAADAIEAVLGADGGVVRLDNAECWLVARESCGCGASPLEV